MTRLITEWLETDRKEIVAYGASVEALTGVTPAKLAASAAARLETDAEKLKTTERKVNSENPTSGNQIAEGQRAENQASGNQSAERQTTENQASGNQTAESHEPFGTDSVVIRAAVVRVTAGLGVIDGFSDSLCALLAWLGADVIVPAGTDVDGIYRAAEAGADIIFLADDDRFICMNLKSGTLSENNEATAYGYAEALNLMAGGLQGEEVLLIGFGAVGRCALKALKGLGASVTIHDKNASIQEQAAHEADAVCGREAIGQYKLIFDATNEGGWLHTEDIHEEALISAPGLPLSLDAKAKEKYKDRIFSDVLQTGAAVMLCRALL
ncbi:MAG: 3-methylornithyl-N6-L-lysine dehydrogenase PylD [Clostridiales Family XIII bacterium]|jgi:pyrrolysine biosynthesis protein PylD|nr:3-methylornithyl-N6-L-lysine dehydrogenase PylD [Clostridiales Family XIII bacterium]